MKNTELNRRAINELAWWLLNGWKLGDLEVESAVNHVMAVHHAVQELENAN